MQKIFKKTMKIFNNLMKPSKLMDLYRINGMF